MKEEIYMKSKDSIKRTMSLLLSLVMICAFLGYYPITFNARAYETATWVTPGIYYIEFKNSGKVLDVTDESTQSGIQMQIWDKYDNHDNQKFLFEKDTLGWKITALNSRKLLAVKDYSMDDYAHITQYEEKYNSSDARNQRWKIETYGEFVRFKNVNSNQYITVYWGKTDNGSKLIQRPNDIPNEQSFKLQKLESAKIISAHWSRNFKESDFVWKKYNIYGLPMYINGKNNGEIIPVNNKSLKPFLNGRADLSYATTNGNILLGIDYIDEQTMFELTCDKSKTEDPNFLTKAGQFLKGELDEKAAEKLFEPILEDKAEIIPFIKNICELIVDSGTTSDWNNAVEVYKNNRQNGVKFIKYLSLEPTFSLKYGSVIKFNYHYDATSWNGDLPDVNFGYDGYWTYTLSEYTTEFKTGPLVVHSKRQINPRPH